MSGEQPTADGGASVTERLEAMLARDEPEQVGEEAASPEVPAVEEPAGDAPDEAEGPQLELSDVAKVLGFDESMLDVDEDGSLKIKTKIDGVEGAAKLQDLVKSYQLQGHIDAKVRQVAEQEKAHAERVNQIEQYAQTKLQELDSLAQAAQQMLAAEAQAVDWDRLVMDDPVGYTAKRHEFERKSQQVQQFLQAAQQQRHQVSEAMQWKRAQELQKEASRLSTLIPEWSDVKTREAERGEMLQWLTSKGVGQQTIATLADAGLVAALRAGMLAEKQAPKVAEVKKAVKAAPKLVRPGQGVTSQDRQSESVRGLKETIRKSGGKQGVAEYLIATGKV